MNIKIGFNHAEHSKLHNHKKGDGFDDWVDINNAMFGYSDTRLKWPEIDDIVKERQQSIGIDVRPEMFYKLFAGSETFSELNAINLYRYDVNMLSKVENNLGDIITAFSGISFVEMSHYDHLQELIFALGGDPSNIEYSNEELIYLKNMSTDHFTALDTAIKSENDTIDAINEVFDMLSLCQQSRTRTICEQLLSKQIADEKLHITVFDNLRKM